MLEKFKQSLVKDKEPKKKQSKVIESELRLTKNQYHKGVTLM